MAKKQHTPKPHSAKTTAAALLSAAALATLPLATSCTDYDNGFDEATISYNQNFIDRYGLIDPNHNWGFEEIGTVDGKQSKTTKTDMGGAI